MKSYLRLILTVIGLFIAALNAFAQPTKQGPVKFDEFGYLNHENYSARLDNIAVALQNEPDSQGFFIFYGGEKSLPGAPLRYMKRLQNYLTNTRGIDAARAIVLEGGRRNEITIEFWISAAKSTSPVPNPPPAPQSATTKSYLYDQYNFDCDSLFRPRVNPQDIDDCSYGGMDYEDQPARLDGFAKAISQSPGATARLVVYSQSRDRRKIQRFIQKEKNYLVTKAGLKAANVAVVSRTGKYRSVELWVQWPP